MFTMIYAIIGIPIGLVMFNSIGERFNYFASMTINKFRKLVKARQPETTEMDLIAVGLTLSGIVFTSGAAAFSHYEGNSNEGTIGGHGGILGPQIFFIAFLDISHLVKKKFRGG